MVNRTGMQTKHARVYPKVSPERAKATDITCHNVGVQYPSRR